VLGAPRCLVPRCLVPPVLGARVFLGVFLEGSASLVPRAWCASLVPESSPVRLAGCGWLSRRGIGWGRNGVVVAYWTIGRGWREVASDHLIDRAIDRAACFRFPAVPAPPPPETSITRNLWHPPGGHPPGARNLHHQKPLAPTRAHPPGRTHPGRETSGTHPRFRRRSELARRRCLGGRSDERRFPRSGSWGTTPRILKEELRQKRLRPMSPIRHFSTSVQSRRMNTKRRPESPASNSLPSQQPSGRFRIGSPALNLTPVSRSIRRLARPEGFSFDYG